LRLPIPLLSRLEIGILGGDVRPADIFQECSCPGLIEVLVPALSNVARTEDIDDLLGASNKRCLVAAST
jgi:hypothetical protein